MKRRTKYRGAPIFQFRIDPSMKTQLVKIAKGAGVTPSEIARLGLKLLITTWRDDRSAVETMVLDAAMEAINDPRERTADLFD